MRISDLLDVIEDDSVPIREWDSTVAQRIKEITINKIHNEEEMERPHVRRTGRRTAALILAACLALAVTAYAAGVLDRVNWKGETVQEDNIPRSTPIPEAGTAAEDPAAAIDRALTEAPEHGRDLIMARYGDNAGALSRTEDLSGPEQLRELLEAEDTGMTAAWRVPEGYAFAGGWVAYDLAAGYKYTLASTETNSDGVTVERYTAPEAGDFVSSYYLEYVNTAGETLTISAQMLDDIQNMTFGQPEGVDMTPVQVSGMDEALTAGGSEGVSLYMGKVYPDPVGHVVFPELPDTAAQGETVYGSVFYQLWADALDADALVEIVTN